MFQDKNRDFLLAAAFFAVFVTVIFLPQTIINNNSQNNSASIQIKKEQLDFGEGTEDVVIDSNKTLDSGEYEFKTFELKNAKVEVNVSESPSWVIIRAKERIKIDKKSEINLDGVGYRFFPPSESVPDTQGLSYDYAGGGGSSGGLGGVGSCSKSAESRSTLSNNLDKEFGASGGVGEKIKGTGGRGGGFIELIAPEIIIEGSISVNGQRGIGSGGGGGGGKIIILANNIQVTGEISATGGDGGASQIQGAGGGSGGMIILGGTVSGKGVEYIDGGKGGQALDLYTGCSGKDGQNGKVVNVIYN